MGNFFNRDNENKNVSDTINWNGINTENMSSLPNFKNLSNDAQKLILNLSDIYKSSGLDTSSSALFNSQNKSNVVSELLSDLQKLNNSPETMNNNTPDLSLTSPFISADVYKYLIESNNTNKLMGGKNKDDSSSTSSSISSTSSTSTMEFNELELSEAFDEKSKEKPKHDKNSKQEKSKANPKHDKNFKQEKPKEKNSKEDIKVNLSYISSSDHENNTIKKSKSKKNKPFVEKSDDSSLQRSSNTPRHKNHILEQSDNSTVSVNTSDINMISDVSSNKPVKKSKITKRKIQNNSQTSSTS